MRTNVYNRWPLLALPIIAGFLVMMLPQISSFQKTTEGFETRPRVLADDSVCADSCPGVLFKLNRCPAELDLKRFGDEITRFANALTKEDDTIAVTPLTSDCVFLAKSTKSTVKQLMQVFELVLANKAASTLLNQDELEGILLQDFEPNFKIHLDVDGLSNSKAATQTQDFWWFRKASAGTDAVTAWEVYGHGSRKTVVAVLDTGISREHGDLSGNIWEATKPFDLKLARRTIYCKTGAYGFDTLTSDQKKECLPADDNGHGTHVAGIIGAAGSSGLGVNKNVSLMALKIADSQGDTCVSNVILALEFAIQIKKQLGINLRVLNNSYYVDLPCDDYLTQLRSRIEEANKNNMVFVASAGQTNTRYPQHGDNDSNKHYPSNFYYLPNVISVTAIDVDGLLSKANGQTANYGQNSVLIGAPGSSILSTYLPSKGQYATKTGTSMAAPFVSGAAALMLSVSGCSSLPANKVKENILAGATYTAGLSGKTATNGRLNIYESVRQCAKAAK